MKPAYQLQAIILVDILELIQKIYIFFLQIVNKPIYIYIGLYIAYIYIHVFLLVKYACPCHDFVVSRFQYSTS